MKLIINRATFSQLIFDAQKTRQESFGITSETANTLLKKPTIEEKVFYLTQTNKSIRIV